MLREQCPGYNRCDPHSNFQEVKSKSVKFVIRFESGNKRVMSQMRKQISYCIFKNSTVNKTFPRWCWFRLICSKGWFRPFEINPVMGIKGRKSRLAARRAHRKTHRIRSCLSAQGQLLRVWRDRDRRYIAGSLAWKQGRKLLWIYGASCAGTSAVFICRRSLKPKGRD